MNQEMIARNCPACGGTTSVPEVEAPLKAETQSHAVLQSFWSGLYNRKCFFTYYRCQDCRLLYNPNFFGPDALTDLYSSMAPNMDIVSGDAVAATQLGYFERVAGRGLTGSYLEIGPDVGHIVAAAAQRSFDHFWLFEPNLAIHDVLRTAAAGEPATIAADMEDLSAVPDGSVGLAVMVHVLDHLLDPLAMLEQIRAKLRPDGRLMIVTHNEASLLRRVMGVRWPPFCLQHPELYNPDTIAALLRRAGFAGIAVERSCNVFPLDFLARQAAWTVGLRLKSIPLPSSPIRLRLGNMLTLAGVSEI
ncbi:MAG: class I SAM-dependent methyltransferase [Sphingopyxis sp.]|nr:class I SAM-dependent methyltransferase [Sphingopyxis sp.]